MLPDLLARRLPPLLAALAAASFAQTPAGYPRVPTLTVDGGPQTFPGPDNFGANVVVPGDIDGDGTPDIVAGAPTASAPFLTYSGRVAAIDGATGAILWSLGGTTANERLGSGLSGFPDVDGDQVGEIAIATRIAGIAKVRLYAGALAPGAAVPTLLAAADVAPTASASVPLRCYPFRDLTNDGIPEAVVFDLVFGGMPYAVIFDVAAAQIVGVLAPASNGILAASAGATGRTAVTDTDLSGDGVPDVVLGRNRHRLNPTVFEVGEVAAYDGVSFQLLWSTLGTSADDQLGASVMAVDDVDQDGVPEIVAGAPHASGPFPNAGGAVALLSGATGTILQSVAPYGPSLPSGIRAFGTSLALLSAGETAGSAPFIGRIVAGCGFAAPTPGQPATVAVRLGLSSGMGLFVPTVAVPLAFQVDGATMSADQAGVVEPLPLNGDAATDFAIGVARGAAPSVNQGHVHVFPMPGGSAFGSGPPATHVLAIAAGPVPALDPSLVTVSGGNPGTPCVLAASRARASPPLPISGGSVLIDVFDPSFALLPPAVFPPTGSVAFPLGGAYALPVIGLTFQLQAVALDSLAPQGVFFSDGWQLTF